ncbi:MAG TPA: hypothetical protein VGC66_20280 [Pyrinomonadaceae bacterium]|jgi:hypothetical protein
MKRTLFSFACGTLTVFGLLIMSVLFHPQKAGAPAWAVNYFKWLIIWPMVALCQMLFPEQEIVGLTTLGSALGFLLSVVVYSAIVYAAATIISMRQHSRYS